MASIVTLRDQVEATMFLAVSVALNTPVEELHERTELIADLGAKSVNFVRMINILEDDLGLEIPFMEFRRKKTIKDAIDLLVRIAEH
ncbi:MAG: acyl carrier protein [Actinobacteria bacterium]|nr:acyl carrier protein [Actinomycetota bacterium]